MDEYITGSSVDKVILCWSPLGRSTDDVVELSGMMSMGWIVCPWCQPN